MAIIVEATPDSESEDPELDRNGRLGMGGYGPKISHLDMQ
jgi:hypothetical protein